MTRDRWTLTAFLSTALAISLAAPVAAQTSEPTAPEVDEVLEVVGVDYAYEGLPASVPAGTSLVFANAGEEVHELAVFRVEDGVTATMEELLAMEDAEAAGLVELIGGFPLIAGPGSTAEGTIVLERPGRYAVVCFIPQGLSDIGLLEGVGPDTDPADLPPALQELLANPPHVALGMGQEFVVTSP